MPAATHVHSKTGPIQVTHIIAVLFYSSAGVSRIMENSAFLLDEQYFALLHY